MTPKGRLKILQWERSGHSENIPSSSPLRGNASCIDDCPDTPATTPSISTFLASPKFFARQVVIGRLWVGITCLRNQVSRAGSRAVNFTQLHSARKRALPSLQEGNLYGRQERFVGCARALQSACPIRGFR